MNLSEYSYNVYSQFGEDGVIQFLINELKLTNRQSCEIGMRDILWSNTYNLVNHYNWYGFFIEKNELNITNSNSYVIQKYVEPIGENSLDNILLTTNLDLNFDLLSIDIDGKDYHIWKNLKKYSPKIVIIEINPFLDINVEYINNGTIFSSSFKSTVQLGIEKDYSLVCMTGNLIFVKNSILLNTSLELFIKNDPNNLFLEDAVMILKRASRGERYSWPLKFGRLKNKSII
jgi:hypothetical protein